MSLILSAIKEISSDPNLLLQNGMYLEIGSSWINQVKGNAEVGP